MPQDPDLEPFLGAGWSSIASGFLHQGLLEGEGRLRVQCLGTALYYLKIWQI